MINQIMTLKYTPVIMTVRWWTLVNTKNYNVILFKNEVCQGIYCGKKPFWFSNNNIFGILAFSYLQHIKFWLINKYILETNSTKKIYWESNLNPTFCLFISHYYFFFTFAENSIKQYLDYRLLLNSLLFILHFTRSFTKINRSLLIGIDFWYFNN